MIVRQSARSSLLGPLLFAIACVLALVSYLGLKEALPELQDPAWYSLGFAVIALPICAWLSTVPAVQRFFIHANEREDEAHARAALEFFACGLNKTKRHTGVLIFLSLMERKCVVLVDEGIAAKLPQTAWQGLVDKVILGIRSGRPASGLVEAIGEAGTILTEHFPVREKHENQLSNQLIIKP